jgi:hypothetical protein
LDATEHRSLALAALKKYDATLDGTRQFRVVTRLPGTPRDAASRGEPLPPRLMGRARRPVTTEMR